ncbi:MAG: GIY-YIG nuclease family protein [Kiritimatiellae bacterium]|nr:GIY-YIG nuclease family protein [Kiritimatiellia bacterium]
MNTPEAFFPPKPELSPAIYAYELPGVPSHKGYLKVGYTERDVEARVKEQLRTAGLAGTARIVVRESAMRPDGSVFPDKEVHRRLEAYGCTRMPGGEEWYLCTEREVRAAIREARDRSSGVGPRDLSFGMRPEQARAVARTAAYFREARKSDPDRTPKFLWNAKMRFGKTFATYQLAREMKWRKVLVLTFKPAVESAWQEDLERHVDFEGWQFVSDKVAAATGRPMDELWDDADKSRPVVVFGSFQNLLGTNDSGGIKAKNEFIHAENWDAVVFDEYHFGAWRENARKLFAKDAADEEAQSDFDPEDYKRTEADNAWNESFLPITAGCYLYLSGTPFRALNSGEFIEEQIQSWTYSDEQREKEAWPAAHPGEPNPYEELPRMVLLTYRLPPEIRQIAEKGEFDEFDLNVFFAAEGRGPLARFVYESEVQKWLDLVRGAYLPAATDDLKLGQEKRPPMPYGDARLLPLLQHTLWFLPDVASCEAMANLLAAPHNAFFHDYKVVVAAGAAAGIGLDALRPVREAMGDPFATKTITLSCGKLTTGVTVKPWGGVFMLRSLKSPETYFQTAFRVQSPWTVRTADGLQRIVKRECYVFDFALDRALRQISDYSCRLDAKAGDPESKVAAFLKFLPVLAYDGSTMRAVNAQDVLDIALSGTSATLLAKRWESALLVNVDNDTLKRLMDNPDAMAALSRIEGFRSLNADIETIINKSEAVKRAKAEGEKRTKDGKPVSEEEKEFKSKRKEIQEKLIKFATRVPVFMYLTDYREKSLQDVITRLEPGLFKKVTGLDTKDFGLLCSLGVFNAELMNDAIFKFKRYEDASLVYTGLDKHSGEAVGGWDATLRREEFEQVYPKRPLEAPEPVASGDPQTKVRPPEPPKKPLPEFKNGMRVVHKTFGEGVVRVRRDSPEYIFVRFKTGGEKQFRIPDAFPGGFLRLKD